MENFDSYEAYAPNGPYGGLDIYVNKVNKVRSGTDPNCQLMQFMSIPEAIELAKKDLCLRFVFIGEETAPVREYLKKIMPERVLVE